MMNISAATVLLAATGFASTALAQTGSVKLVSPIDGAMLDGPGPFVVGYFVVSGP